MSIITNPSFTAPYGLAMAPSLHSPRMSQKQMGIPAATLFQTVKKPQRHNLSLRAQLQEDDVQLSRNSTKKTGNLINKATSAKNSNPSLKEQAVKRLTEEVIKFCTVNSNVPLPSTLEATQALAKKLQPYLDVPLDKDPAKAQKQLYLAGNDLISKFRALDTKHIQPVGLVVFREGDEFLQDIGLPNAVIMSKAQHPVTHVAYAETVLRCDLPRGTPPAFGLKLLEPGWVVAASLLDPFFAKGQQEKPSPKSFVNNLTKNFQKPPKEFIEFSRDEFDSVMLNAHALSLALKPKDDLERMSYGVQLFKMMDDVAKAFKKHSRKANAEEAQAACQLGIVSRNKKNNQLEYHNITPEFRRLFQK
jgi:hypothetical protein